MDKTNRTVSEEIGSDVGKVLKAIEMVKEKNKGQYLINISEICLAEYGWSQETTAAMLQRAQEQKLIHTVISHQKISYRISSHPKIYIEDDRESIATQTEHEQDEIFYHPNSLDSLQNDLEDFKRFSHGEILSLKAQLAPRPRESPHKSSGPNYEALQEAFIRSLQDRIISLERQLSEKQETIGKLFEKLLEKPRPTESYNVNKNNCHCIQSSLLGESDSVEKRAQAQAPENKESPQKKESNEPRSKEKKQKNKNNESTNSSTGSAPQETTKESKDSQQSKAEPSKADKKRKKIIIIGDSILNGLDEIGLQRNHNVRVRAHPGATSRDIVDHIKPAARKQPDCIIIHAGTNDLTNGVDTIQNLKLAMEEAKKESPNTDFALSTITIRKDKQALDMKVDINKANNEIKNLATKLNLKVIENTNIDMSCLGKKKLHLNQRGDSLLAGNFIRFFKTY